MTIRTRFAPSPTGYLHVGGARTALFSWLYARRHGGTFILRIEDTDRERSTAESVDAILQGMTWLGLEYDEGPFFQTQRFPRYQEVIEQMLKQGTAYHCYCTKERLEMLRNEQTARKEKPRYDGKCRHGVANPPKDVPPVVRFRNSTDGAVMVEDLIRGRVTFRNAELDDLIIARSDGTPTYNFTVVVDDMDMRVTHVIRGDDHLNNTPRQMNMLQALGVTPPVYAHVPMILGPDGARLSKRHGAVSVMQYRDDGYLPEALLNYLVRLGWSHGDQEVFSVDEMVKLFDVTKVHSSAAAFNPEKLLWLNQHYIKNSDPAHVAHHLSYHLGKRSALTPPPARTLSRSRRRSANAPRRCSKWRRTARFSTATRSNTTPRTRRRISGPRPKSRFWTSRTRLAALPLWLAEPIHATVTGVAEAHGLKLGKVAQPLRVAIAGRAVSPPIDMTLALVGREKTLKRLDAALLYLRRAPSVSA